MSLRSRISFGILANKHPVMVEDVFSFDFTFVTEKARSFSFQFGDESVIRVSSAFAWGCTFPAGTGFLRHTFSELILNDKSPNICSEMAGSKVILDILEY
ncbi:hypothetical protein AMTR_s00066p00041660 [Amborella trichopoda]|uniref:Uncharacterized protein n=1 Tax=Amborella trichopoda TaxID=13333 RepID=U5DHU4_AMBTC|nr:hypothetical protein AMTR_s00066p00041660 [Amborella trichopoda]